MLGKTAGTMKVNTETTRRKVTESSNGLMVDATKDFGKMENSTVKVPTLLQMVKKKKVNGKKVRGLNGFHYPKELQHNLTFI